MPLSSTQTADIQKQYDPLRKRAQQQEAANLQGQNDAMARRAAMQGGGPGGAYEKQAQLVQGQSAQRLQSANEGIDAQQQGALNQAREVQDQRDFQRAERVGSQDFSRGERLGSQDFSAKQAGEQRKFLTGERLGTQDWQAGQAVEQRKWQTGERADAQRQQDRQFQQQMDRDAERFLHEIEVDQFNMDMAEKMFNKKDLLEQLFGNFSMGKLGGLFAGKGGGQAGGFFAEGDFMGTGDLFGRDSGPMGGKSIFG